MFLLCNLGLVIGFATRGGDAFGRCAVHFLPDIRVSSLNNRVDLFPGIY